VIDNVFNGSPETKDPKEGTPRESAAIQNVLERKEPLFVQIDSSNFDILAYLPEGHDWLY